MSKINLNKALADNTKAKVQWDDLTPIARRDFLSWIGSAKQSKTREGRIQRACSMLAAGKRRPCCYAIVPMNLYKALGANKQAKAQWSGLTPDERRDFADAVESVKEPAARQRQIEKVCAKLVAGKRRP